MRITALLCATALLAGCDMVTSTKPLFFAADAEGQPQLRPGVWVEEDPACAVDATKPLAQWPSCANAWIVRPGEILAPKTPSSPRDSWTRYQILLARGDPAILQITGDETGGPAYVYAGLRPVKTDAEGRIVEYRMWIALCGPPAPKDPSGKAPSVGTREPIEGLAMDKDQQDCLASDPAPVRVSVQKSEAWNGGDAQNQRSRWVREGED